MFMHPPKNNFNNENDKTSWNLWYHTFKQSHVWKIWDLGGFPSHGLAQIIQVLDDYDAVFETHAVGLTSWDLVGFNGE